MKKKIDLLQREKWGMQQIVTAYRTMPPNSFALFIASVEKKFLAVKKGKRK